MCIVLSIGIVLVVRQHPSASYKYVVSYTQFVYYKCHSLFLLLYVYVYVALNNTVTLVWWDWALTGWQITLKLILFLGKCQHFLFITVVTVDSWAVWQLLSDLMPLSIVDWAVYSHHHRCMEQPATFVISTGPEIWSVQAYAKTFLYKYIMALCDYIASDPCTLEIFILT